MRPIYYSSVLIARSDDRPLSRDLTISSKPIRKKRLALYVIGSLLIIVLAYVFISPMLEPKRQQITFADGKTIAGDGDGPYTSGSDGVNLLSVFQLPNQNMFVFQSYDRTTRSIFIRFDEAEWKDRNLSDIPPELPSKNYSVIIACGHRSILINTMDIGKVLEPYVWFSLYEADTGEMLNNSFIRDLVPYNNRILPQEPLSTLYEQGHAVLTRQSEDVWILDIDAWFTLFTIPSDQILPNSPKDYVKISFVMTINVRA